MTDSLQIKFCWKHCTLSWCPCSFWYWIIGTVPVLSNESRLPQFGINQHVIQMYSQTISTMIWMSNYFRSDCFLFLAQLFHSKTNVSNSEKASVRRYEQNPDSMEDQGQLCLWPAQDFTWGVCFSCSFFLFQVPFCPQEMRLLMKFLLLQCFDVA